MSLIKLNDRAVKDVTQFGSISSLGSLTHISTATASSSASIEFTSGIDSTYKEYIFYFVNIHQSHTGFASFNVNFKDGGSLYDSVKTTSKFEVYHTEADATSFAYSGGDDLAQSTASQRIGLSGYNNDESMSGYLHLFNPSSTTFVKHFISRTNGYYTGNSASWSEFVAGYCNTTSAIDGVQFDMSSGNIDAGQILLFGVN